FDLKEPEIILDDEGMVEQIAALERNVAHRIIEEFMLVANETVAQHLDEHDVPTLYRIHEQPDPLKVEEFEEFIGTLAYSLGAPRAAQRRDAAPLPAARREDPGEARGKADRLPHAADDAEGPVRPRESGAFRSRGGQLHAFHVADPPLSGSGRPSHAARIAPR